MKLPGKVTIGLVLSLILLLAGVTLILLKNSPKSKVIQSTGLPKVAGLKAEDQPANEDNKGSEYPVYEKADRESKVIHYAGSKDRNKVVEVVPGWYRVEINEEVSGWIPKEYYDLSDNL